AALRRRSRGGAVSMRIAYVHGYDGVTGSLLLGACLDAGVSLACVQEGWSQLQLPAAQVSCARVASRDAVSTEVTCTLPQAVGFLPQQSYAALVDLVGQSDAAANVKQRVLHMLRRFVDAVAQVHGVTEGGELALRSAFLPEVLYLGSGVACALEALAVAQVVAAPIPLSTGYIEDAGRRRPLPHPLTAALCRDVPVYGEGVPAHEERTTV